MGFNTRIEYLLIEVIEKISLYLHDEDLIRFFETFGLSTNMMSPKFISMKILQIYESKEYGLCLETSEETWDNYIKIASQNYVTRYTPKYIGINKSLKRAARINDMALVNMFTNYVAVPKVNDWGDECKDPNDDWDDSDYPDSEDDANDDRFNWGLVGAAKGGHMHIVKLMIEKGASNYVVAANFAVQHGHINIVKFLLDKGVGYWYDSLMCTAATYGHIDIVYLMLTHGATKYKAAMHAAASKGNMDIVKLMLEQMANDNYNSAMCTAEKNGHKAKFLEKMETSV